MPFCAKHQHAFVKVCSECTIEDHRNGEESKNGDLFKWSSYWGSWSRVLSPMGKLEIGMVEVDLTAVNPNSDLGWPRVLACNIRAHGTSMGSGDYLCKSLPSWTVERMKERMDEATYNRLMHEDLLPLIDWYKYRKACNGGAALSDCLL